MQQHMLGRGAYACVRRAQGPSGEVLAVKRYTADNNNAPSNMCAALVREVVLLQWVCHERVVALHHVLWSDGPSIVMPAASTSLAALIPVAHARACEYHRQLRTALEHVHARGVLHRDVKPANVLVYPTGARLCDFGSSAVITATPKTDWILTTYNYAAPEVLEYEGCDSRADLWSLGVLTLDVFYGRLTFAGLSVEDVKLAQEKRIVEARARMRARFPHEWTRLLHPTPSERCDNADDTVWAPTTRVCVDAALAACFAPFVAHLGTDATLFAMGLAQQWHGQGARAAVVGACVCIASKVFLDDACQASNVGQNVAEVTRLERAILKMLPNPLAAAATLPDDICVALNVFPHCLPCDDCVLPTSPSNSPSTPTVEFTARCLVASP